MRELPYDIRTLSPSDITKLDSDSFRIIGGQLLELQRENRKEWNLLYYEPVSEKAKAIHLSDAKVTGVFGGNRSSKTDTILADFSIAGTGVIPLSLRRDPDEYEFVRSQLRGPINMRIVCESLTTTLHQVILRKLQWNSWNGMDQPGGKRGHFGWIPKRCLINGSWEKSWSEKFRTLKMYCLDPDNYDKVLGISTIQFMSFDQDPTDFASGEFHRIHHDEPPSYPIWRENEARVISVGGRLWVGMTWPDEPTINVDWLFDEVYEKGMPGSPKKDPHVVCHTLWSTDNQNIDQEALAIQEKRWSKAVSDVRVRGQTIRFANRVHADFTDIPRVWCFECKEDTQLVKGKCANGCTHIAAYCHVDHRHWEPHWPVVWVLDPHPRKPHMFMWIGIDPRDDWHVLLDGECHGDPVSTAKQVFDVERERGWQIAKRLIDPNMGRSVAGVDREIKWQDEFEKAGLFTDLADNSKVGRERVDQMLKIEESTERPRLTYEPGEATERTVLQMKRYMWDDFHSRIDRDQKQTPKDKYDDYPTMLKYLANDEPTFARLAYGSPVIQRQVRGMKRSETPLYQKDRYARRK